MTKNITNPTNPSNPTNLTDVPSPKKRGRLSLKEKYAIQGMLHDKKSEEDIAKVINRNTSVVTKYINTELTTLQDAIARSQTQEVEQELDTRADEIAKVLAKKSKPRQGVFINTTTEGNRSGVSVATKAASEQGDDFKKHFNEKESSRARTNILFKPKDNLTFEEAALLENK